MTVPNFLRENTELKLKKLNKVDEFGAYFSIPFVTDVHNAETTTYKWLNSIKVIEEVNKRKNINYILTGGDYINNHENKEEVIKRLKNFKDRFEDRSNLFITLGNHDDNSNYKDFSKVITHEEMKKLMFSDMQDVTLGNGLYYYKDFHNYKIRLIVLNSEDIPEYDISMKYKGQWDYAFSNDQLNWVAHTALNTDYKIIFCSHTPMLQNVEGFDLAIRNSEAMLGIMKAYTTGTSYSSSNNTGDFKYNVSVDYNKKGTIVCCLFGHVHADNIVYKDNIAHISTTCSNCSYRYGSSRVENATGTVNEIALDFLTVRNNMGFLTRFGAGSDRSFTYVNNTKESKKEKSYPGIKLLGENKKIIALLQNLKDLSIESILESGDKTLSFSYAKEDKFYENIIEENYIRTKEDEFVIKSRDIGVDYTRFDCVLNLEELEANIFDRFESVEQTITNAINLAIVGTGWTVNDNTLKKKRTVRCTNKNALEIVKEIKKTYRVDIVFNTLEKKIEVYEKLGEDKGAYFIDSLNLTALQVQSDSYKFATRIIAEGKDNLTFEDINGGKNYVENFQYSKKIKTIYWKDERYTVKESLLEDARAKLEEISKPFTSYNASVLNLAELNPKYKSILDYSLGDTIALLSKSNKVRDKQRIVKTVEYPQDHSRDTVELANAILKFEDIQQENQETTDTVNNITTDNGTVDGSIIDSIQVKQIEDFKANVIEVVNLKAINASIDNLKANKADIQDLHAVNAKIGTLEATKANITQLNAVSAEISKLDTLKANIVDLNSATAKIGVLEAKTASIDNLLSQKASINDLNALNATISEALIKKATIAQLEALETKTNNLIADKANIKDLNVTNANINKIQAETASIKTLLNGNLSSENIQAGGITSDKLTIANGFITNLMISSVSASKITAGTIDAAKINVVNLNADNLTVGKINGQLLKDGSISGLAIENGAIDNSKVSSNANIEASKINISSVVTAINDGSTLLTANKVSIDSEKGTLDIAFNNLNTSLEDNKKITESNSTAINVVQGKLSASIENSKILEGKQKTLEDNYNRTVVTVDSLKNTIGQQKTLIDSATGKITSVEVKANTLEKNLSGLTQTVTDTKKVIENNKTVLESKNAELKANIDSVSSSLSSVSSTVDKNNKTLVAKTNTLEQNLSGLFQTVANNKTVIDGKITSVEGETHELKAGLGGLTSKLDTLKSTTDGINKTVSNQGSVINQLKDSINLKVDSSTFTQSTQTINNNINRAKEQAIIGARSIPDTRSNNENPGWYMQHYAFQTITEFKYANVIGVPNGGSWYGTLETTVPWNNASGGYPTQVFRSNSSPVYQRHGTDLNTWSSWEQIEDTQGSQAKANNALNNAKSYSDSKKQEAIKAAENLALEKSNLAKKYADEVATAKANLAQANAIANADGKITEEERKRIQQAQENLNTAISKADKAKQDAINEANRVAELKKQEAISSANSHADNKASEALNSAKTFVNAEITTVNSHLNKATSEINVLKKQIELKVGQSDIDKSIQKVNFGGRNLIKNSYINDETSAYGAFPRELTVNLEEGETYCFSIKGHIDQVAADNKKTLTCFIYEDTWKYGCVSIDISSVGLNQTKHALFKPKKTGVYKFMTYLFPNGGDRNGKVFIEWAKLEKGNKPTDWTPAPEDTNQLIVDNIKTVTDKITTVESKFTQENNSIKASVQDLNSTTQSITTNVSNINRDLTSKINSNLNAAKSFATDIATNKANTTKQEAINSANSHADSIAASKANEALNNAKGYTNTEINVVNTKVHNVESNIDILKNKIALKVEQSDIDKTKTELINKINVVDNLANNAKDLASAMSLGKMLFSDPTFKNSSNNIKTYNNNGNGTVTTSRISKINGCPTDSQYCIEVKTVGSASPNYGGFYFGNMTRANAIFVTKIIAKIPVGLRIGWYSNATGNNGSSKWLTSVNGTGKWEEYIHLLKCGDVGNFSSTSFFALDGGITPSTSNPIVWHLAYATVFDITENDESVNVLKTEMSTAKNKVATIETNLDSITQRVSSTESKTHSIETTLGGKASKQEVTEVNNRVATIKANLDGITQRVSATESKTQTLESNLNGKASKQEVNNVSSKVVSLETNLNGITNRVSNTESRINTLDGKVASAVTNQQFTEFKQSNDKFKFTVEQRSSVSNILPNGSFFGGDRGWLHNGSEFWAGAYSGYGFKGRITGAIKNRAAYNNPERYLQTHKAYKVKKNTTYTINFNYICEKNVQSMDAFVVLSNTEYGDYAQPLCILTAQGGSQSNAAEEKPFTYKFNTGNHEWVWLRFDHNGMKSGVNWDEFCWIYVSEVGIYEGDVGAVKWTPKGGEVYSANYQMDGLGFKGTFEDGTYASLGKDGLEWYNAGTGHAYHALTYVTSFDIPVGNPGKAYIKLPAEFTKRRSSLKWTVALRGYYYSTSGNFFPFHVHCTGARDYVENGLVVCEVQGLCKIQNGSNSGDVQFRPLTAMLIAIA
ncbi:phage tail spike protein [Clostridium perfringens]|uniref:phage tail spike protein n=1 Tax=Clostridium perfringens TaxID=1502 RepID=UPI001ABA25A2|nr:phage tail spike protein [Clostridium perfringens]MBO3435968.1 phage tail protein [Clostridium perfringens]